MRKSPTTRLMVTAAVVSGAVVLSAAVAVLALVRSAGNAGMGPLTWLLPLATFVVVCGIGLLLFGDSPRRESDAGDVPRLRECDECKREVSGEWRLCPWCGCRLDSQAHDRAA